MISRHARPDLNRDRFPVDPWRLIESYPRAANEGVTETIFAIGNGFVGMRANHAEGRDAHVHGTYINGFHETWSIHHAEAAYGFAQTGQTIINAPDTKLMKLYVDDKPLQLAIDDIESYERVLDFRTGVLSRNLIWRTQAGERVEVEHRAMASFSQRHLVIYTLKVTMLEGDAPITISSQILNRQDGFDAYYSDKDAMGGGFDPRRSPTFADRVLEPQQNWHSDRRMLLGYRCRNSAMTLAVGADHTIVTDNDHEVLTDTEPDLGRQIYRIEATEGQPIYITKAVAYHTSHSVPVRELFDRVRRTLDRVRKHDIEHYFLEQRRWLDQFWENTDVQIEGHPELQQALRWNLFQVAQASARADSYGVPAKGLTGSGYEGHYFWDSEIYVLPMLAYTNPTAARNMLHYRAIILDNARVRASVLSQRGALFPWRTISGEEASAYYAAGTAQYHIDADIAYAIARYVRATGDQDFMLRFGAEILVETARLWADLGFWYHSEQGKTFHIHGVTGPDEYTTVVNDNLFTNVMARFNLETAAETVRWMKQHAPQAHARLTAKVHLDEAEVDEWQACAAAMVIPFDDKLGIHPQDEHFLEREMWDLSQTPVEKRPLLLHYHPLVIYRFQVLKQADVVMALTLQGDRFTPEQKRADFEYYDPLTTGDSSLSAVAQSIIAAEVGHQDLAMGYFLQALFVDLCNLHKNTEDGVHVASAGGVWNAVVYGFAGMRDDGGLLRFDPRLPEQWPRLSFKLRVKGTRMRVDLTTDAITFTVEEGERASVSVRGTVFEVTAEEPRRVELADQGPVLDYVLSELPNLEVVREDGSTIAALVPEPSGAPTLDSDYGLDPEED